MISEAHMCWLVHRAFAGSAARPRPEGHGEEGTAVVTAEQVLHWGSASGARMLGFDGVGSLAVGHAADLAVYDLNQPRYFGLHDPAIGPIVSGGRPRLQWLLVNGRIVVEDDTIPGLDMAEMRARAQIEVRRLMEGA
jgi:cytosine/adenosine deaminase-related metal-dependent hydrolase